MKETIKIEMHGVDVTDQLPPLELDMSYIRSTGNPDRLYVFCGEGGMNICKGEWATDKGSHFIVPMEDFDFIVQEFGDSESVKSGDFEVKEEGLDHTRITFKNDSIVVWNVCWDMVFDRRYNELYEEEMAKWEKKHADFDRQKSKCKTIKEEWELYNRLNKEAGL